MNDLTEETIKFRLMTEQDLDLFFRWLHDPLLVEVWLMNRPMEYEEVVRKYLPRIEGKTPITCFIITLEGNPVGYIQSYLWRNFPEESSLMTPEERNSATFDMFIGESALRGKGFGTRIVSKFLDEILFKKYQVDLCIGLTLVTNSRAIRSLEKAGFKRLRTQVFPKEPAPTVLMAFRK